VKKVKVKIGMLIPAILFLIIGVCQAQTLSTKETKVVLIVDSESNKVTDMALFSTIQKMDKGLLKKKYPNRKFYIGLLRGNYEIQGADIIPKENTSVIMFTEKQIFPEAHFFSSDDLSPGDSFDIGKTKSKVVYNKKGELKLKT